MLPSDTPWGGLEPGRIDMRRIDAKGRWNFFWAVMPRADAALVLMLTGLPDPIPPLPKLRNLEVRFQTLPGGPILYIRLKDSAQMELFETLCRDVVAAGEVASSETEALERAIGRTFRWHYLLRGGKAGLLTEEAQKGLIGELEVLRLLINALGSRAALAAWSGPDGAPKDFELTGACIEVKARRGASQPFVKISNEFQLADVADRRLWLSVLAVDRVQPPNGFTLNDKVNELAALIASEDTAAILDWELHLADAGFDPEHDYSAWRWIASEPVFFEVKEGFPRIAAPIPLGISGVNYSLLLSACEPFRTRWQEVSQTLDIGDPDESA